MDRDNQLVDQEDADDPGPMRPLHPRPGEFFPMDMFLGEGPIYNIELFIPGDRKKMVIDAMKGNPRLPHLHRTDACWLELFSRLGRASSDYWWRWLIRWRYAARGKLRSGKPMTSLDKKLLQYWEGYDGVERTPGIIPPAPK
ncbi:uncharacterized protein LOC119546170 [Drosophila subpulchrella]|uniref:uncharacterized protein LOC119546170 n=1 Tax=Drosophila subpulchrella TaxID=1486046 RepID=UPI0018A1401F|nr:uncharacterized protein LOC119546170 [Drosophila subpulchrella]